MKSKFQQLLLGTAIAAALVAPLSVSAQEKKDAASRGLGKTDTAIVTAMAQANMAEIEAGKLALANGSSAEVKAFAQKMVDDHTKALNDVTAVAMSKNVTLPTEPDAKHKAMAEKLRVLKGDAFDKEYMAKAGVQDHKHVHAMLKKDEARASDPEVKALAAKMLPTVAQHLEHATKSAGATAPAK
jgi:putative membrane protein